MINGDHCQDDAVDGDDGDDLSELRLRLPCCGNSVCAPCLRQAMVDGGGWRTCLICNSELPAEISTLLFREHCSYCGETVVSPARTTAAAGNKAKEVEENKDKDKEGGGGVVAEELVVVALGCGYSHRAHMHCLQAHVREFVSKRTFPVQCPGSRVCQCSLADSVVMAAVQAIDNGSESAKLTLRLVDMAKERATMLDPSLRPCPDPRCGHVINVATVAEEGGGGGVGGGGAATDGSTAAGAQCPQCSVKWCMACWTEPYHPGFPCDQAQQVRADWVSFLAKHVDSTSSDIQREMEKLRILEVRVFICGCCKSVGAHQCVLVVHPHTPAHPHSLSRARTHTHSLTHYLTHTHTHTA